MPSLGYEEEREKILTQARKKKAEDYRDYHYCLGDFDCGISCSVQILVESDRFQPGRFAGANGTDSEIGRTGGGQCEPDAKAPFGIAG